MEKRDLDCPLTSSFSTWPHEPQSSSTGPLDWVLGRFAETVGWVKRRLMSILLTAMEGEGLSSL